MESQESNKQLEREKGDRKSGGLRRKESQRFGQIKKKAEEGKIQRKEVEEENGRRR